MAAAFPDPTHGSDVVDDVLENVCVEWGFCLHQNDAERIRAIQNLTADQFADEVLLAEFGTVQEKWKPLLAERFNDICAKQRA